MNITEHYPEILLQVSLKKLKLMGGAMKYFLKKLPGREIFRSMVSCKTLRPPSYILNVRCLKGSSALNFKHSWYYEKEDPVKVIEKNA